MPKQNQKTNQIDAFAHNQSTERVRSNPQIHFDYRALSAVWLLFYGLLVFHGLSTSYAQRLPKAWAIQDENGGAPGSAEAMRLSLELSANRIVHQ